MYDVIIKNGSIVDGTGKDGFISDVGIKNDEIAKIGDLHDEKAELEIDATGKIICPGFIDVANHSDTYWRIFLNPSLESLIYQGITTIVGGNCGSSLAPLISPKTIESIQKWIDLKNINVNWLRMDEFFDFLDKKKFSVNFSTLVGHATLRRGILNNDLRNPNPKELNFIKKLLKESMREGALGLSTGLIYTHAHLATSDELTDLAKLVSRFDGVYSTHIRDEADDLVESVEEAVKIARDAKVKLHISHLKAMGKSNWHKMDKVLDIISHAGDTGIDISFDVYPYTNTGSVLYTLLPSWVAEGGKKVMLHRLKDPAIRTKVILEMKRSGFEYDKVEIAASSIDKALTRRKITEIAASQNKEVEETIIDILLASEGRVITSMEVLSEENIKKAITNKFSMISSNGSGYSISHSQTGEIIHPRSFGTFPKVLSEYVFKEKILSLPEAIRKMTSYPAEKFGLKKRGKIKKGFMADILVLDKNKISSSATKENPYRYSKGIEYSFVNGKLAIGEGFHTGGHFGQIIKR